MDIKVAILGDLIIDKFKYFNSVRLSPEGPAPVVKEKGRSMMPGGAGNLSCSISNMELETNFYYPINVSESLKSKKSIENIFEGFNINLNPIETSKDLIIPLKIRYYVDSHYFMREDIEKNFCSEEPILKDNFLGNIISQNDLIVISDYQKGCFNSYSLQNTILKCLDSKKPIFIDTKNNNKESIKNAYCLKINKSEFDTLFPNNKVKFNSFDNIDDLKKIINIERKKLFIRNLVVTIGSKGSILANDNGVFHVPSSLVEVIDLTGAGDAYLAALIYSHINNHKGDKSSLFYRDLISKDIKFANKGAESVVCKKGTAPLSRDFIKNQDSKKKIIGFTNGCFDVLHVGHLSLLKQAKENCDYLIVGLNSDSSIKKLKGNKRPINIQEDRIQILSSLNYVDEVRVFEEETPIELIKEISPDLLVKGEDYAEHEIIGSDYVKKYGGKVLRVKLFPNKSTTNIINSIKEMH